VLRAAVGELKGVLGSEIEARRRATATVSADAARLRESDRQTDRSHLMQVRVTVTCVTATCVTVTWVAVT
jgi:hypothetical protein